MASKVDREERRRIQKAEIDAISEFITPELTDRLKAVMQGYKGSLTDLESAIGALFIARFLGWRTVRLIHSGATYAKYERLLTPKDWPRFKFSEHFIERTENATRSNAVRMADSVQDFWKVASGLVAVPERAGLSLVDNPPSDPVG